MSELLITRRNGDEHVVLFDEEDAALVESYTWNILDQQHTFYARAQVQGRPLTMHRLILPGCIQVDHINGNGLDNRRVNLRPATLTENLRNKRVSRNSTSGYKGVFPDGNGRWRARICCDGVRYGLGSYDTPEQAAVAYDAAAATHFGSFAHLNFPLTGATA